MTRAIAQSRRRRAGPKGPRPIREKVRPTHRRHPAGGLKALFPKLRKPANRFGTGVAVIHASRDGGGLQLRCLQLESAFNKPARRPRARILASLEPRKGAGMLAGLAHPDRLRIAVSLMTGSESHKKLSTSTGLAPGPLYHHLRAMMAGGIVTVPSRNFYTLSKLGEILLLTVVCIGKRQLVDL